MARFDAPFALDVQDNAVVKPRGQPLGLHHPQQRDHELDPERQPIELAADVAHRLCVVVGQGEILRDRPGAFVEEPDRVVPSSEVECQRNRRGRKAQARDEIDAFSGHVEHLPAGREDEHVAAGAEDGRRHASHRVDQVLAIVEDDEGLPALEIGRSLIDRRSASADRKPDALTDSFADELRLTERGELH